MGNGPEEVSVETVVVEFEGVLCGGPDGRCIPEGKRLVERALTEGKKVVIYDETVTMLERWRAVREWLKGQGLPELQIAHVLFPGATFVSTRARCFGESDKGGEIRIRQRGQRSGGRGRERAPLIKGDGELAAGERLEPSTPGTS